jgi:hypothetical protein
MKIARSIYPIVVALAAAVLGNLAQAQAVNLQFVPIGNPGNANDTTGYGGVSYTFYIAKYTVTLSQYTAFLNAVAKTDTYSLYDPSLATDLNIAGISRSGASGGYSYSVIGDGNRPVTYISWLDAARFVNWLNNGCRFHRAGCLHAQRRHDQRPGDKERRCDVLDPERERMVQGGLLRSQLWRIGRGRLLAVCDAEQQHAGERGGEQSE